MPQLDSKKIYIVFHSHHKLVSRSEQHSRKTKYTKRHIITHTFYNSYTATHSLTLVDVIVMVKVIKFSSCTSMSSTLLSLFTLTQRVGSYFAHFFSPEGLPKMTTHTVFLLDVSLSMYNGKLDSMKEAMKTILKDMQPEDTFEVCICERSINPHLMCINE